MRRLISFAVLMTVFNFTLGFVNQSDAGLVQIVSPSAYENVESPDGFNGTNHQDHYQQVFLASDFASLPAGVRKITQFAYRPDAALDSPGQSTYESIIVRLSTTSATPGNLSMTYAENIGPDETLVLSATNYVVSTQNLGPSEGPKVFDLVYAFDTPFEYDPSQGNLLLDILYINHSGTFSADVIVDSGGATQMIGNLNLGDTAAYSYNGGAIVQFTFVPEPSTITLFTMAGLVGALVAWRKRRRTQRHSLM